MLDIYGVIGQMALKSTICDIVYHVIRIMILMNTDLLVYLVMIGLAQDCSTKSKTDMLYFKHFTFLSFVKHNVCLMLNLTYK